MRKDRVWYSVNYKKHECYQFSKSLDYYVNNDKLDIYRKNHPNPVQEIVLFNMDGRLGNFMKNEMQNCQSFASKKVSFTGGKRRKLRRVL